MKKTDFEFALVLPCYNEAKSLENILQRAVHAAQEYQITNQQFQLILVENGSKDNSIQILESLKNGKYSDWFQTVRVVQNQGYGYGLWVGLEFVKNQGCKYVGWSHADQQCDPKDAFKALSIIKNMDANHSLVKGIRKKRNWKDTVVSRVFEFIAQQLLGDKLYEINAQPKVFSVDLLNFVKNPPRDFAFDLYVLYCAKKNGFKIETFAVDFPPRIHGFSNWSASFFSRFKHIKNMIIYIWQLSRNEGRIK